MSHGTAKTATRESKQTKHPHIPGPQIPEILIQYIQGWATDFAFPVMSHVTLMCWVHRTHWRALTQGTWPSKMFRLQVLISLKKSSISLVQFSCSVVSDSLWSRGLQHARFPSPSPVPGVYLNPCPLSQWCHPAISSSVIPFSFCPQSFPTSGSFPESQSFESGGQSIGVSASTSVLLMNIQDWSPLGWTGWISLQSKGLSRVFSNTTVQKHQFFFAQLSWQSNSHIHTSLLEKP